MPSVLFCQSRCTRLILSLCWRILKSFCCPKVQVKAQISNQGNSFSCSALFSLLLLMVADDQAEDSWNNNPCCSLERAFVFGHVCWISMPFTTGDKRKTVCLVTSQTLWVLGEYVRLEEVKSGKLLTLCPLRETKYIYSETFRHCGSNAEDVGRCGSV